jgi:hypothetical protein
MEERLTRGDLKARFSSSIVATSWRNEDRVTTRQEVDLKKLFKKN